MENADRPFRIGFVLSTALGNATRFRILQKFAANVPGFECHWAPVKHFYGPDEHDPVRWARGPLRSRSVVIAQSMPVLKQLKRLDAVVVHQLEAQPILNMLRALGRAVVATDVGAVSDVIADEVNGLIVPGDDDAALAAALLRLVRDPTRTRTMGQHGRARIEREFDAAHNVPALLGQIRTAVRTGAFSQSTIAG